MAHVSRKQNVLPGSTNPNVHSFLHTRMKKIKPNLSLYVLISLPLAYFIIFCYWPIYGVQIAFKNFSAVQGIMGSPWVGFAHFQTFFDSIFFDRVVWNTVKISVFSIVLGFPAPIILALLINELKNRYFQKVVQNISYAPYFISQVVMVGILIVFLSPSTGLINQLTALFGWEPISFMQESGWFKTIFITSGIWQGTGWGTVIYMAVLAGVDHEQIEAAVLDGANKFQRIWYISLPYIMPTAVILFILSAGSIMNVGFEKVFLMQNSSNMEASDVISTFVYRKGLLNIEYSFATAVGLFNSLINFFILIAVNRFARRTGNMSLW
ncbi:ABC transporter permease [Paenibacillus nasutitermitis]|uniref:Sugar ABC transporter permease n=1 Tax=Paenibacillus nasutitermitis TaxID=1652958 RepID=A0A916Z7R5_9BACL|nr:ABC transporter permease subunit [Paenibacillus nasutitermitis]GGD79957.1 sugar ABC transporter permease [Paenibacillus nasutitermitis]